jgi:hypothetical protein
LQEDLILGKLVDGFTNTMLATRNSTLIMSTGQLEIVDLKVTSKQEYVKMKSDPRHARMQSQH